MRRGLAAVCRTLSNQLVPASLGIESMRLSYLRRCSETYLSGYCFHDAGVPTASLAAQR
jgi:hypothetical protein